jgi:PAS domain S-box-containing protein
MWKFKAKKRFSTYLTTTLVALTTLSVIVILSAIYAKINGFNNLYYQSSLEALISGKHRVSLWIGLFAIVILALSIVMSIFLGHKMVKPLGEMTKKKNSRYKELLENLDDAVYLLDQKGNLLDANAATYAQLGYTPKKFLGLNLTDIIPPKDARLIVDKLGRNGHGQCRHGTTRKITLITSHKKKEGNPIPVEIHSRAITYRGRNVILNVARDITEQIEAEKTLRESEERYRSVVEYAHDGIMIMDENFRIIYANHVLAQILGYATAEIDGSNFSSYLAEDSTALAVRKFLNPCAEEKIFSPCIYRILRKDGEEKSVKISANRFQDSTGEEKTVAQVMDITDHLRSEQEKKHLETQLIHSRKMEAVGTLAGGIAHDFNNLLMGIQGYISLMRLQTETNGPIGEYIQGIENAVMNAANLTSQLLGFARKGKYTLKSICLNTVVENSLKIFTRTRKEIVVHQKLQPNIWDVKVDPGQIEQVLINLYLNAWQAMPDGGDIFIQTENIYLSDDYCQPFEVMGGNYVKVSVTDTGMGIDAEIIGRIFEPFFTTKDVGKGTGLGLASAYGIIKNHDGIIRVYSEKGQGATFNIYLPAKSVEPEEDEKGRSELLQGSETILLVDDEESTIQVEELMLKQLGYTVMPARSGKVAVELFRKNRTDVDLVALDMIMPEMSGRETYHELKRINPDVKVLLVSGYSFNKQIGEMITQGCCGFIQKPFDIVQLSQKIREILENEE